MKKWNRAFGEICFTLAFYFYACLVFTNNYGHLKI